VTAQASGVSRWIFWITPPDREACIAESPSKIRDFS
jgi:hypothetical protein